MVLYQKKAPPHLAPLGPTAQKVRIPTERKKRGINRMVSSAGSGEAHKGKELGKESGEGEVNDNPVGGGEALKGKELRKESGKGETTDNSVGDGKTLKEKELGKESGKGEVRDNPVGGGKALNGK